MGCTTNSNNNLEDTVNRCLPTVMWGTLPVNKTGIWVINNGANTAVINKRTVAICNTTNNNHLSAVVGTVVASVAKVAVAAVEEE